MNSHPLFCRLLLLAMLLFLSACDIPSADELSDKFYTHQKEFQELNELIVNEYTDYNASPGASFIDHLRSMPEYTQLAESLGVKTVSVRDPMQSVNLRPAVFFVLAREGPLLRIDRGVVVYPGDPPVDYRRRVVSNLDQAERINVSESTETFQKMIGEWYIYERVWT